MKHLHLIIAIACCLLAPDIHGQSYKGFDFFFNGGMYKGNSKNATYYNGGNNDIRIGRILGNSILKQEIDRLVSTAPYTYRFLLEDNSQKEAKKEELQYEIREYEQYSRELDDVLKAFPIKEMFA